MGFAKFPFGCCTAAALALLAPLPLAAEESAAEAATAPAAETGKPAEIPTSMFAARSPFGSPAVSPDGKKIAMRLTIDGVKHIAATEIDSKKLLYALKITGEKEVDWFRWAGDGKLILSIGEQTEIYGVEVRTTRLFSVDLASGAMSFVGPKRLGIEGDDVLFVDPAGGYVLLSYSPDIFSEPEVARFPLDGTGGENAVEVQGSRAGIWEWVADDAGTVRIGLGWAGRKLAVWYRRAPGENLKIVGRLGSGDDDEAQEELWDVLRVIGGDDEGYMLEKGDSGRVALRKFNYATREVGAVIYENPDWDLTDFDIDENGEPEAVYYTDDRDRVVWLDPAKEKLQKQLQAALKSEDVWIGSTARDDSRMIVWLGGATDPGAAFIYTPATKKLDLFAELRPGIHPSTLAEVRPVNYTARDGTNIRAYLTLPKGREAKALPLVILPHGGPYGVRDQLQYDDEVQLLANRGYAVLQPNFRGSSGYGEEFEKLGDGQMGRGMQDDLDDGMDWAVSEGIADPTRVCVVGSSYGGYAALWAVTRNPERYRCAASFAGVTDLDAQLSYNSNYFSSGKRRKAWRERVRGTDRKFDLDTVSPARQAALLTRPVLVTHGKLDSTVPFKQFEKMRDALKKAKVPDAEFVIFDEQGHGFDKPEDEQRWYDALVAFLAKHNPAD